MSTPALTPEEWSEENVDTEELNAHIDGDTLMIGEAFGAFWYEVRKTRHAVAALALHGQPFGFTQDDVDELRRTALDIRKRLGYCEAEARIEWLSDKIAALLPPDGKR